ncbi:MAG: LarC family nickel insertion protein, partial [Phycisphaerae bacterium]|nr:LarC family nickel insertion protein [Phycisphaerae bacterium]
CSELVTGRGTVPCAHGILPVPAPATAELIRGVVSRAGDLECELLTPTGAAILTTLAEEFGGMPGMKIDQIGYGAGTRELTDRANVLRVMIGQSENIAGGGGENEKVWVLEANIDDASGELIAHVSEQLMNHGACDVYNTAIMMKKGRPGVKISVICKAQQVVTLEKVLFQESTTFGIRRYPCDRTILERDHVTVNTAYGEVRIKRGRVGGKVITRSVEFSDCQKGAKKHKIAVKDVMAAALAAYK